MAIDLVTGGAGFIGSHLVARLVREGRRVRVLDDLSTGRLERLQRFANAIDVVRADLVTADLPVVLAGVARVFHLAAVPSVTRSVKDPMTSHAVAATGTLRLLLAAHDARVERFVFSSSSSVYGETAMSPKHEEMRLDPVSPYGVAKAAAEGYVTTFARLFGMRTVSLRYFNVFGPSQDPSSQYAAVVPLFVTRALRGQALTVYGDGRQTRDFTFVDNVVDANLAAAAADGVIGRVFNVAAGRARDLHQLIAALERIVGHPITVGFVESRPGDIRHSHADISAARAGLGWTPRIEFEEGLRRTVDWYRGTS